MHEALLIGALLLSRPIATPARQSQSAQPAQLAQPAQPAQPTAHAVPKTDAWYFSWGYNTEHYAGTDIQFVQAGRGNDFTLPGLEMRDSQVWDIWNHPITVPQYSWRIGRFIRPNTAIELNFDHAKAILVPGQHVQMTGTLNGAPVNQAVNVDDVVQVYKLNNGANFVLVNVVQRFRLVGTPGHTGSVSLLAKAGAGFTVPHTENVVLNEANKPGFQYGGLGAGLEGVVRVHVYKMAYVELSQKGYYAHYRNLHINDGHTNQNLWAYVTVISFGSTFDFGRN